MVQDVAAIKNEGGLHHPVVDLGEVQCLELLPLREHAQRVTALAGVVRVALVRDLRIARNVNIF